jgi:hypothetical protein
MGFLLSFVFLQRKKRGKRRRWVREAAAVSRTKRQRKGRLTWGAVVGAGEDHATDGVTLLSCSCQEDDNDAKIFSLKGYGPRRRRGGLGLARLLGPGGREEVGCQLGKEKGPGKAGPR